MKSWASSKSNWQSRIPCHCVKMGFWRVHFTPIYTSVLLQETLYTTWIEGTYFTPLLLQFLQFTSPASFVHPFFECLQAVHRGIIRVPPTIRFEETWCPCFECFGCFECFECFELWMILDKAFDEYGTKLPIAKSYQLTTGASKVSRILLSSCCWLCRIFCDKSSQWVSLS